MHASRTWWVRSLVGSTELILLIGAAIVLVQSFGTATDLRVLRAVLINIVAAVALQTYTGPSGIISFGHVGFMALGAYGSALFTANPSIKASAIPEAPGLHPRRAAPLPAGNADRGGAGDGGGGGDRAHLRPPVGRRRGGRHARPDGDGVRRAVQRRGDHARLPGVQRDSALCLDRLVLRRDRVHRPDGAAPALFRIGPGLRSSREDVIAALASGVDVYRSRYVMWVASAGLSAVAGALYAHTVLAILPQAFHFQLTFLIVTMVIIGGQSITGAVVGTVGRLASRRGAAARGERDSLGSIQMNEAPGLTTMVLGLIIVLTLTLRPQGLLGRGRSTSFSPAWER